jgi:hypothetical protein
MPIDQNLIEEMTVTGREIYIAEKDDAKLGPLRWLPGKWENTEELKGFGFNMIALPFDKSPNGYRLLMNQYNEALDFFLVDAGVPNRGVDPVTSLATDQTVVALSYTQIITQIASEDSYLEKISGSSSTLSKSNISDRFDGQPIHHEPGLWLYMTNNNISGDDPRIKIDLARMGSIPHGNSFTAVGSSLESEWEALSTGAQRALIPSINGVVVGGGSDPNQRSLDPIIDPNTGDVLVDYFAPYRHFNQNPFQGRVTIPGFSGLDPVHATALLRRTVENVLKGIGVIKQVKQLQVDSTLDHFGINRVANPSIGNTPFITRQADTTAMNATFIVYEIEDSKSGRMRYFLQYAQNVILDFINRPDGHPGRARWPHVSINTMERVSEASPQALMESLPSRQKRI